MCKNLFSFPFLYIYYTKNFKNRPTARRVEYLRRLYKAKGNERDFTPARHLFFLVALVVGSL